MKRKTAILAIVPIAMAIADERVIERVFQRDSDLYAVYAESGDSKRLTTDGCRKEFITISNDRTQIAFVSNAQKDALGTIVIVSADGKTRLRTVFRRSPRTPAQCSSSRNSSG